MVEKQPKEGPGHGALWGAMRKNEAWLDHTTAQGGAFYAPCHEAGVTRAFLLTTSLA